MPWEPLPGESEGSYEKFLHFRDQGPDRKKITTAAHFGVSRPTVTMLSKRWNWIERAQAWDVAKELYSDDALTLPERLQQAASRVERGALAHPEAYESLTVSPEVRARELEHEQVLEEYRAEYESLGRRQMKIARAMTNIAGNSVAAMVKSGETLHPRAIPGFLQSAIALGQAAHQNWGKSIGVDRLLLTMQQAVMEMEQRAIQDAAVQDAEVVT
jgi:hypothetical protein